MRILNNDKVIIEFGVGIDLDATINNILNAIDEDGNKIYENAENFIVELEDKKITIKEYFAEKVKYQIANIATQKVKDILKEYDYDNEGEVALYAANENSEWYEEAKAIQTWIEAVYKKMYELQESITIDNYKTIDLDKIEAEFPEFTQ